MSLGMQTYGFRVGSSRETHPYLCCSSQHAACAMEVRLNSRAACRHGEQRADMAGYLERCAALVDVLVTGTEQAATNVGSLPLVNILRFVNMKVICRDKAHEQVVQ